MRQTQQEWPELIKQVRGAMNLGIPPTDPSAVEMGRRWYALVQAFTGGDANLERRLKDAYGKEPQVMTAQGMDKTMFAYIRESMQAAGLKLSA
ncbi:MAG TPA: TipAS antibiotic-recognition domain-containing protein [Rhodanobacteraceae bacterium]|nr:TipAS antibiotic-recognition domain-containing protein [Rhodanobacteraceae bacterium]